jgi:hypothetical protein
VTNRFGGSLGNPTVLRAIRPQRAEGKTPMLTFDFALVVFLTLSIAAGALLANKA